MESAGSIGVVPRWRYDFTRIYEAEMQQTYGKRSFLLFIVRCYTVWPWFGSRNDVPLITEEQLITPLNSNNHDDGHCAPSLYAQLGPDQVKDAEPSV